MRFDSFRDQVVVITGAASGIGEATAEKFADNEARVVVVDKDVSKGERAVSSIGERAVYIKTDITQSSCVKDMVAEVVERFGKIDILINNAGIIIKGRVEELSEEDWDRVMNVNVKGMFLCCRYVVPVMLARKRGVIVNVGSEAGLVGIPGQPAYNVSKAAAVALTKSMAVDYAQEGIRVNAVCPGTTLTPLVKNRLLKAPDPEGELKVLAGRRPLKRLGKPEEIAYTIMVAASEELGYSTGAVFSIDGGFTAQ